MGRVTLASLVVLTCVSCGGPPRYPAPPVSEIGRGPRPEESPPPPREVAPPPAPPVAPPPPQPVAPPPTAVEPPSRPAIQPVRPEEPPPVPVSPAPEATQVPRGGPYSFLDRFAADVARGVKAGEQSALVVLPPFAHNPFFHRYEVTRLGDDLARELLARLGPRLAGQVALVTPEQFARELQAANRSLGDLDSPQKAVSLAARCGMRYTARGSIEDTRSELTIRYECIDVLDASAVAQVQESFGAADPEGRELFSRHKTSANQPLLSDYRIGVLAPEVKPNLRAEVHWIVAQALERVLGESAASLRGKRIAAPPTLLPRALRFEKRQQAMRREVQRVKKSFLDAGLSELYAMSRGPLKILDERFENLGDAEQKLAAMELNRDLSAAGELSSTLSRIIFEHLENRGMSAGFEVIPHDDLITSVVEFSREEMQKIQDGILDEKTKEYFETKGAHAILMSELLESGDSYEFVFRIRQVQDLKPLSSQVRFFLEPRFAYLLTELMKG